MQQCRNWHFGKMEFYVDLENTDKNTQFKIQYTSEVKVIIFLWKTQDT